MATEFDDSLAAFDFEAAAQFVSDAAESEQADLRQRLAAAREDAEERAESLAGRIQSLARADHYEGLLSLADDPDTQRLLDVLSPEIRRGAQLHLDGARRRQQRFQASAAEHMQQASEALLLLDTTAARAALDRIDRRWLDADQAAQLDELLGQTEAAAAERRDIEARTAEVLREHEPVAPPPKSTGRIPVGRARNGGRGCAGSALILLSVIGGLVAF